MNIQYLIIDGSNVARTLFGDNDKRKSREHREEDNRHSKSILSLLNALHRRLKIPEIKVYFDGTVRPHEITPRNLPPSIHIEFGAGKSADELMFAEARAITNSSGGIVLITDDKTLTREIRALNRLKVRSVGMIAALATMAHVNIALYLKTA